MNRAKPEKLEVVGCLHEYYESSTCAAYGTFFGDW